jgi:hypothetical protein
VALAAPVIPHLTEAEAEAQFRSANEACLKDDFTSCVDGYERLSSAGFGGADLSYNLGTAYLRMGKLGHAVLHLARALREDPGDADALANLEKAQRMRVDKLVGAPEETAGEEPLSTRIVSRTRANTFAVLFLALWTTGGLLLALRRLSSRGGRRGAMAFVGSLAVALSLPSGAVLLAHVWVRERAHDAVVVAETLPVREGPQESFKVSFEVHEGLRVRILDEEGRFRRVRLANGLEGWIPSDGVEEITPG